MAKTKSLEVSFFICLNIIISSLYLRECGTQRQNQELLCWNSNTWPLPFRLWDAKVFQINLILKICFILGFWKIELFISLILYITTQVLEEVKVESSMERDTLINVARTSLRTKTPKDLADHLTEVRPCSVYNHNRFCVLFWSDTVDARCRWIEPLLIWRTYGYNFSWISSFCYENVILYLESAILRIVCIVYFTKTLTFFQKANFCSDLLASYNFLWNSSLCFANVICNS